MSQEDPANEIGKIASKLIEEHLGTVSRGMTVLISRKEEILFFDSFGSIEELDFSYSKDTIYDLASLTKPVATSAMIFKLLDSGYLTLEDTLEAFPLFQDYKNLHRFTVRSLISHSSGLVPTIPMYRKGSGRDSYLQQIDDSASSVKPGKKEDYSDLNYILLGFLIEDITGRRLNESWNNLIRKPYGLKNLDFKPELDKSKIAPTEFGTERGDVWGKVHDENSYFLDGVAGHAGLFGDMESLHKFLSLYTGGSIISPSSVRKATSPANLNIGGTFGYGWMINVPRPANPSPAFDFARLLGDIAPFGTYGHSGFTGPSICIEPVSGIMCLILANRVYPTRENNSILRFRRLFHNLVLSNLIS